MSEPSSSPEERQEVSEDTDTRSPGLKSRLRAKARKKARKQQKRMFVRRKMCRFCADTTLTIDYKDAKTLRLFVMETGRIIPQRISGNCALHQRRLSLAVKRARQLALIAHQAQPV